MNAISEAVTAEALLAHERLVRAVARDLLRDEHAVQDVVQDTWLRALRAGPRALAALPRWLGRVAGNRARDVRRAATRRRRHEEVAASVDGIDATDPAEAVEAGARRLAVQRDVVAAILALHEPYRTVVLLRYQHGLTPAAIAERTGTPPGTVRVRLTRAHELLRERLDHVYGRRDAWGTVLAPWCLTSKGSSAIVAAAWLGVGAAVLFVSVRSASSGAGSATPARASGAVGESVAAEPDQRPQIAADPAVRRPVANPGEVRVATAAGAPAANLPVWYWSEASRPLWTKAVEPLSSPSGIAAQLPRTSPRPPDAGPAAARTDGEGALVLPGPLPAAMTLQIAEGIWWTVDLPAASPLVLPELAEFAVRVIGLPDGASWDLDLGGAPNPSDIGDYRVDLQTASGRGIAFAGRVCRSRIATERFATDLLAMHPARLVAVGHGVKIELGDSWQPRRLPALVELPVVGRVPTTTVRVFERDGSLTTRTGGAWIGATEGWLSNGAAVFDSVDFGRRPTINLRMHDGQSIRREVDFSSAGLQRSIDLRLDDAIPPVRVHVPDLTKHRVTNVIVQWGGNNQLSLTTPTEAIDTLRLYPRRTVGLHDGALWIAEFGPRWETPDALVVWERLAIANEQGALALVPRPAVDVDELWGAWEPMAPPRDLDVGAYAERLAIPAANASLMFELPAIPSRRRTWGTGAESRWQVVRTFAWNRDESPGAPAPVWRGLTLATTVKWRLAFVGAEGQEVGVFDLTP